MIQINLLPPEYRPRTGTPVARFVAIVVGVVLVASATGVLFYTHFIELANTQELRDVRAEEATSKERQRDYSMALQREIDVYEKRRNAIQTINRSRTLWSRKLDQFFDIVTSQTNQDAYQVWLDTLEVPPQLAPVGGRSRRAAPQHGGLFRFAGYLAMESSSDAPALSSLLFRALTGDPDSSGETTPFFEDFQSINNPNIAVVKNRSGRGEVQLLPPVVGSFRYELLLEPPAGLNPKSGPKSGRK